MRTILFTLLACSTLLADDASKAVKIDQLLTVIKANDVEGQIYKEVSEQIEDVADQLAQRAGVAVPERGSATADLKATMTAAMKRNLNWGLIKPTIVKAYTDAYSEAELDQLLVFFKSPVGQKYLAQSPLIADQTRTAASSHMKDMQAAVQKLAKEWLDAHQIGSAPTPAPPR